jgi:DNA-binding CsgD family transcriptional regulator
MSLRPDTSARWAELRNEHHGCTRRQWLALRLMADGHTRAQIAEQMDVLDNTVSALICGGIKSLGLTTEAEAVHFLIFVGDVELKKYEVNQLVVARSRARKRTTSDLHNERRAKKICINNATHGPSVKGGRCQACWDAKLAGERSRWAARRRAA